MSCSAIAATGSAIWLRLPSGSCQGGIQLTGGIQCRIADVKSSMSVASQKFGIDSPMSPPRRDA